MRRTEVVLLISVGISLGLVIVGLSALAHTHYPLWLSVAMVFQGIPSALLAAQALSRATTPGNQKNYTEADYPNKTDDPDNRTSSTPKLK